MKGPRAGTGHGVGAGAVCGPGWGRGLGARTSGAAPDAATGSCSAAGGRMPQGAGQAGMKARVPTVTALSSAPPVLTVWVQP